MSKELLQWVREKLAEEGTEYTSDQLAEIVASIMVKVRRFLRAEGVPESEIPESDTELFDTFLRS